MGFFRSNPTRSSSFHFSSFVPCQKTFSADFLKRAFSRYLESFRSFKRVNGNSMEIISRSMRDRERDWERKMASEIKGNVVKVKSSQSQQIREGSTSKGKGVVSPNNSSKTKIIKYSSNISKSVVMEKTASISSKTTTTTTTTVKGKTEKKVYTLPGQKHDPPEEREPLRIFYESLSKQIPTSEMAEFWMMEHGLLSPERAKKAYERKQKKQQQLRTGTPIKSPQKDRSESLQRKQSSKNGDLKAKKRMNYSDDDDDFIGKPQKRERPS